MLKFRKFKYLFFIFLIFNLGCANIHKDVFRKKPDKKDTYRPPEEQKPVQKNYIIVKASEQDAWDAAMFSISWIKWKVFNQDPQDGTILLKEAYVFDDNNKLKRIYHWPPKDRVLSSNISDYLKKVTRYSSDVPMKDVAFTQENMKFKLTSSGSGKVKIAVDYQIFPYTRDFKPGSRLQSSYYIEDIIFGKIKEYLYGN